MLLGADEALVFFLSGNNESYVFALTREGFEWQTISLGEKNMAAKVADFRRGLDVDGLTKSVSMGKPQLFDLAVAQELYGTLFGPVEALIKDKAHLLIVPSGPLTALPFHLLVTDPFALVTLSLYSAGHSTIRDLVRTLPCRCRVRDDCREKQRSPTPIYDELARLDELHQELISNPEKEVIVRRCMLNVRFARKQTRLGDL